MRKLLIVMFVLGILLSGCSSAKKLTVEDHGSRVRLGVGDTLEITLESKPSTGYSWTIFEIDQAIIKPAGDVEYTEKGLVIPGSCCDATFNFEAVGRGETGLVLGYHREWEEDIAPIETFVVTVIVE